MKKNKQFFLKKKERKIRLFNDEIGNQYTKKNIYLLFTRQID